MRPPRWLIVCAVFVATAVARAQLEPQPGERELQQQQAARVPKLYHAPALTNQVEPIYPEEARDQGLAGAVVLRLTLDEQGLVDRAEVVQSAGEVLDWSALGAATQLEFSPAQFVLQPAAGEELAPCDQAPAGTECAEVMVAPVQLDYRMVFELAAPPAPPPAAPPPPTARLTGLVREAGTKRPLEGVEVVVLVSGTPAGFEEERLRNLTAISDADGAFTIEGLPVGSHKIQLALSGYEASVEEQEFAADEEVQAIFYLVARSYSKFTTVVREKRPPKEVTKVALQREEVQKVPGTFGDPLRVIENLPGLARSSPVGGSLLVRGSSPGDSGVYFDGVGIPILYHFGGLTSVINAEFLEDINFYPGGFGAKYGRATAGIVDVESRDLDLDEFRGTGEVDLLDSGFFLAGPLDIGAFLGMPPAKPGPSPQKITFAAAARRSYIDALLPFAIDLLIPQEQAVLTASPIYWDYQTKVEYRPEQHHKFSAMVLGADDNLKILARGVDQQSTTAINMAVHQMFHRAVVHHEWQAAPRLSNVASLFYGYTAYEIGADLNRSVDATVYIGSYSGGLRDELTYKAMDKVELVAGADVGMGSYQLHFTGPISASTGAYPRIVPNLSANLEITDDGAWSLPAFYTVARLGPFAGLTLIPGFRFDWYKWSTDRNNRFTAEPRLTARWEVVAGTVLKGAFGVYEQNPDPQQLSAQFGNPKLDLPRALHYIAGYEHKLTDKLNLSVELYFNDKDRQVTSSDYATVDQGNVDLEFYNNRGIGRAYGVEVLLRHDLSSNFYGWVAYTLSRSESRNADQGFVSPVLSGTAELPWYVTSYDQTHILTVVAQYRPPAVDLPRLVLGLFDQSAPGWLANGWRVFAKDWSIGGRFRLVTGDPTTSTLFALHNLDNDNWANQQSSANSARLPTFHQLDVRVDRKLVFESFIISFYLDLLNAYNQPNVESMISDYRYRKTAPVTGLPIIPVIGVQGEF
ncbi:MAG: TonB family protein [Deltaproteobacteria bacterium]|nr:TonB family protein [Deltaproteobacteria bacterium]